MHKIVVLDGYTLNPGDLSWEALNKLGEVTVYDRTKPEDVVERIGDADVILTNKTLITREVIEACKSIRYVGCLSTGYNVVDLKATDDRDIVVTNIPAYGTEAVAQHTMALLLEIASRVGMHADAVREGQWTQCQDFCFWNAPLFELNGKTMGIIGYGAIGQAVARKAETFGMEVLAYSPSMTKDQETAHCHKASVEEIYEKSDVIALHCPLNANNAQMINKKAIEQMKDGVVLLNTSRGGLIQENDLAEALNCGKVSAAGLDVVSTEPIYEDNPLLKAKNVWITPHIAWAPKEARERLLGMAIDNVAAFLAGTPTNRVHG